MKQWIRVSLLLSLLMVGVPPLCATVAPIVSGQSLWWIVKRIGLAVDSIESKVDLIDTSTTGAACGVVELSQSTVSGGTLAITTPGSYCLKEDITADVTISTSCVLLDMNGRCVTGTITISSGSYSVIKNGFVNPPIPSSTPTAGIDVVAGVTQLCIDNVTVECADSGAGGGIAGRDAVEVAGNNVQIQQCTLIAGAGGSSAGIAGVGGDAILTSTVSDLVITGCVVIGGDGGDETSNVSAGDGGHGISLMDSTDVIVDDCIVFRTGNGGAGASGIPGNGGHGIALNGTINANIAIKNCIIQKLGDGGNTVGAGLHGGNGGHGISVAAGTSTQVAISNCIISDTGLRGTGEIDGDGGNGVLIGSSNVDIAVHHCTISNTGFGTVEGKAVDDNVAAGANASKVYANFAHDIANAIKFDLQASGIEGGFELSNPPSSTAVNVYANVFI